MRQPSEGLIMSRELEEWEALGLDPRQWAYSQWWSAPEEGEDPRPLDPQPAPPRWAWFAQN